MRKVIFIIGIVFLAVMATSCVKNRVCKCTSAINPTANENFIYEMEDKTSAEANCENEQFHGRVTKATDYTCVLE
jgi:hypothetical protein